MTSLSERYKDEAKKSEKQNALLLSKLQKCDAKLSELEKEVLNNMFDFLMQKTGHVCSAALNSVLEQEYANDIVFLFIVALKNMSSKYLNCARSTMI